MKSKPNKDTLIGLLQKRAESTPQHPAIWTRYAKKRWQSCSWKEFWERSVNIATNLLSFGLKRQESIAILMKNSVEWEWIQHGAFLAGTNVVGLDLNDPPDRLKTILSSIQFQALFVDDYSLLERFDKNYLSSLKLVALKLKPCSSFSSEKGHETGDLSVSKVQSKLPAVDSDDLAMTIFTSGTTGEPQAMSFSHGQVVLAIKSILPRYQGLPERAHLASWLPLANPFQRIINFCAIELNFQTFMVADPTKIIRVIGEINPHLFAAVPRFYEKVYESIEQKIEALPFLLKKAVKKAMHAARQHNKGNRSLATVLQYKLGQLLILGKFQKILGKNVGILISGSAPLSVSLLEKFQSLGWLILECYGISENIVPIAISTVDDHRFGSVGKPLVANSLKFRPDGEIQVKCPGLSKSVTKTDREGYYDTGDIGELDEDGFLWLKGRGSDLFKLSTGRKVVPRQIEEVIQQLDIVDHAVVYGKNKKMVSAVVNVTSQKWKEQTDESLSEADLVDQIKGFVSQNSSHLPSYYQPADYIVVHSSFSIETGELTANLKTKRDVIIEKYGK